MPTGKSLKTRLVRRFLITLVFLPAVMFVPAGTLMFWPGWAYTAVTLICSSIFCAYFYKIDPQLLERRLLTKEKVKAQRLVMLLMRPLYASVFMLPGFDYQFGWTRASTGPVPAWLQLFALLLVPVCYLLFVWVMKANRFAASIIQVEAAQTVCSTGPYRLVRHPYYSGSIIIWLAAPLALGSFVTLPAFALIIPILVFRLLNEEQFLRRELPGYSDYCQRTRYRLIPFVW